MAFEADLICGDCIVNNEGFGSAATCADDCAKECCQSDCAEAPCSAIVCYANIETLVCEPTDSTEENAGMISDITLTTGATIVPFYANEKSEISNSGKSRDEDGTCTTTETVIGKSKISQQRLNWLENNFCSELVRLGIDGCGRLWAYGWNGGFKLSDYNKVKDATNQDCYIDYGFRNTTKKLSKQIDWAGMGYASADELLLALAA